MSSRRVMSVTARLTSRQPPLSAGRAGWVGGWREVVCGPPAASLPAPAVPCRAVPCRAAPVCRSMAVDTSAVKPPASAYRRISRAKPTKSPPAQTYSTPGRPGQSPKHPAQLTCRPCLARPSLAHQTQVFRDCPAFLMASSNARPAAVGPPPC